MAPVKSSLVWQYYEQINPESSKCILCKNIYSTKGRTTSTLKQHLRSKHIKEYNKTLETEKQQNTPVSQLAPLKQSSIEDSLSVHWEKNHPKNAEFDKLVSEMIALDDQPFSIVENVGRLNYMSFRTDVWSDTGVGVSLCASFTCQGIDANFQRISFALKCEPMTGSHTGRMLSEKLMNILLEWNIQPHEIHIILRDGGANIKNATTLSDFGNTTCAAHLLQLCLKVVLDNAELARLIANCKSIATHFSHSILAQNKLEELQRRLGQPSLCVLQDCKTRWNSTLYMLERLLEIKEPLCLYTSKHKINHISSEEWSKIDAIVKILNPFKEATKVFCCADACISCVIQYIDVIKTSLERYYDELDYDYDIKDVIHQLQHELRTRFDDLLNNAEYTVSTYLDPRFKCKFFDGRTRNKVRSVVLEFLNRNLQISASPPSPIDENEIIKPLSTIDSLLLECLNDDDENNNNHDLGTLLTEYETTIKLEITCNPLQW